MTQKIRLCAADLCIESSGLVYVSYLAFMQLVPCSLLPATRLLPKSCRLHAVP